ncbi:hypothetical protein T190115A13A_10432 [Tenacibaculum sp. 190524A02b]|uniref:Uncharacterized protein n=1 Tax=Tenacibaculum vairaonense TaxID=3137860 RepID=A0ABP1F8Y2_9FLAO
MGEFAMTSTIKTKQKERYTKVEWFMPLYLFNTIFNLFSLFLIVNLL